MPCKRDEKGRFIAGTIPNPTGRPKVPQEVRDAIRAACPEAVEVLIGIMRDAKEKTAYRLEAAKTILERGYGKPEVMSKVELTTTEDTKIIFHWINEDTEDSTSIQSPINPTRDTQTDRGA